jgi:DNA polymerase kappa
MKKPDSMTFFGFKKKSSSTNEDPEPPDIGKRKADVLDEHDQWETWPDERLFEDAERREREDEFQELESLSQELEKRRHHGKEIVPNPKKLATPEEEWWDCPICLRPQFPDEKDFNNHIDRCLSMQTIRDVVQESATSSRDFTPSAKKAKPDKAQNRGGLPPQDPKQKQLFFG